jgi:hypothetical protein
MVACAHCGVHARSMALLAPAGISEAHRDSGPALRETQPWRGDAHDAVMSEAAAPGAAHRSDADPSVAAQRAAMSPGRPQWQRFCLTPP